MSTPLPRPKVEVTPARERDPSAPPGAHDVTISREGFATVKTYRTGGGVTKDVVRDAIEQIIGDRHTGEYLP